MTEATTMNVAILSKGVDNGGIFVEVGIWAPGVDPLAMEDVPQPPGPDGQVLTLQRRVNEPLAAMVVRTDAEDKQRVLVPATDTTPPSLRAPTVDEQVQRMFARAIEMATARAAELASHGAFAEQVPAFENRTFQLPG